jgi:hypothetical protein
MSTMVLELHALTFFVDQPDQWAPTLTEHDPNPPITLEDPSVDTGAQQRYFLAT